ncbi:phytoene/squalene synthase family protein [Sulfobacillus sp. DSM 109850]|uniref:Phytoene/squalene synthase family protein n=2 Tax=Sulfobacillus harzensis TaxID=2729629 RepID=A0A7Y0L0H7_9FIRM|nr:phytoene/squalene synthase family protein [Sulfobacillus harzensis]
MGRIDEAHRVAAERVKMAGSSFYYGMRLLPPEKRSAIYAIYAWSRMCDDAVDDYQEDEAWDQLERVEEVYLAARSEAWQEASEPVAVALGDAIRRFRLSDEPFRALLRGMRMDLEALTYRTYQELETYCLYVAGSVGVLCVEVFGATDVRARRLAAKLGVALQLTNIIRDLKEDAGRGRRYLPAEDFENAGMTPEDLPLGRFSPQLAHVLAVQAARAEQYYREAAELFSMVEADSVRCLRMLYGVYYLVLQKIKQSGFNVWEQRIGVSRREILHIVGGTFWRANA